MKYKCTEKCFYNNILYKVGDILEGECDSPYFVDAKKAKEEDKPATDEPTTYFELQQQEAKELLSNVEKKPIPKKAARKKK